MEELLFLQDLATVMVVSAIIMIVCYRFKIPVVLGYIFAGVIIGPHTPPYSLIHDLHNIHTLSELGVIFLLFSIGLEFSLTRLMKVGMVAFVAATLEIVLMISIGFFVGRIFGWNFMNSLFLGAILSVSSTTIIAKVLIETKKIKEKFAQVILGILIIEDLLAIVIIVILSGVALTGSFALQEIGIAMAKVLAFVGGILLFGFLLVPWLLRYLKKFESSELLIVTVLGLCFGVSLLGARAGFSVALGAFLIGAIIAETKQADEIIHKIEPIRDMFTAIFFVSIGMLINPIYLIQYWLPILVIVVATIIGKVLSCSSATFLTGYSSDVSLKVGLGLAQIGEFSFIIARLGETTGVTSPFLFPITVSVSAVTTLTTPLLMNHATSIVNALKTVTPRPVGEVLSLYTAWIQKIGEFKNLNKVAKTNPVHKILRSTIRFFLIILAALIFLIVGSNFLPQVPLVLAVLGVIVLIGSFLFESIRKFHLKIEDTVIGMLDSEKLEQNEVTSTQDELIKLIREEYPWQVATEDFILPYKESAINQTLRDLRLRALTGASVVAIYRGEDSLLNPSPETKLLPGDVLMLMGDEEQLKAAIKFLTQKLKEPLANYKREGIPKTYSYLVTNDSFCLNKTLKELKLGRKTGVNVLGIQKAGVSINNPGPDTVLEEGNTLVIFGWPDQIESVIEYLSQKET